MVSLAPDHGLEPYYRRELLARYAATDRATRRRGRQWYPRAAEIMADLAADTGYSVDQCVAVLAITSPGIQLRTNLDHTARIMRAESDSGGRFPNVNRPKISAVLADAEYASEYVRGPKVGPFFKAILGDVDALVLDRWAFFAATGTGDREEIQGMRPKAREAVVSAYRKAARSVRIRVRDFQATVWIHARETTPLIRNGRPVTVRLADITA